MSLRAGREACLPVAKVAARPDGGISPVTRATWSEVIRGYCDETCTVVRGVANLLYDLVHVVGGLVLLEVLIKVLLDPQLSLSQLVAPGVGSLAALPGLIKLWRRSKPTSDTTAQKRTPQ